MRRAAKFVALLIILVMLGAPALALGSCMPAAQPASSMPFSCHMAAPPEPAPVVQAAEAARDSMPCCEVKAPISTNTADQEPAVPVTSGVPLQTPTVVVAKVAPASPAAAPEPEQQRPHESQAQSRLCTFLI